MRFSELGPLLHVMSCQGLQLHIEKQHGAVFPPRLDACSSESLLNFGYRPDQRVHQPHANSINDEFVDFLDHDPLHARPGSAQFSYGLPWHPLLTRHPRRTE
jgi:hypothetical protein